MKKQIYSVIAISGVLLLMFSIFISCKQEETFAIATVETIQVTSITEATAACGGIIKSDGGSDVTACGVCWSTSENPTTADSTTAESYGLDSFTCIITGLTPDATYFVRSYATNGVGTSYGNQVRFRSLGTVTDIDGNVYKYILIGNQRWMVENLKTTRLNDGTSIPLVTDAASWQFRTDGYCFYNNDASNKNKYGAIYHCAYGKLAPIGWHIPTNDEWYNLENNQMAKYFAAQTDWLTSTNDGAVGNILSKNNSSGFSGLPGGYRGASGEFVGIGEFGGWWTSTNGTHGAYYHFMHFDSSDMVGGLTLKDGGISVSVRCVRNEEFISY